MKKYSFDFNFSLDNPRLRAILGSLALALFLVLIFLVVSIIRNAKVAEDELDTSFPAPYPTLAPTADGEAKKIPLTEEEKEKFFSAKAENPTPLSEEEKKNFLNQKKEKPTPLTKQDVEHFASELEL